MSHAIRYGSLPAFIIAALFAVITFSFISCTTAPTNPYDKSNTKIFLVGKSSLQVINDNIVADSVGNTISIGFYGNLPSYLDSVQLKLVSNGTKDSVLKVFNNLKSLKSTDTTWFTLSFSDTETKIIVGTAYINNYNATFSDSITVHIYGKPINHKPHLIITGLTTISAGQQCSFIVTVNDTDKYQRDSIVLFEAPSGAVFNAGTFLWTPPLNFTGIDSAVFIAQDNGYPVMFDTAHVIITVSAASGNRSPKWQNNAINEVGSPGNAIIVTLSNKCTDPDGDPLTFSLLTGSPSGDSIANSATNPTYSFTPGPTDTGMFYPKIVASDSKGGFDTLTIALTIHVPVIDSLPPTMTLLSPVHDSTSVSSSALTVKILCTDPSGVASVKCLFGADTFPVIKSDSGRYSAAVSSLKTGVFNTIFFIAVDSSSRANRDTLFVHIKYDSTIADNVPPIITMLSPSKDTIIGSDSCVIRVKCTDVSGIQSVVCKVGTQTFPATKSIPTDSVYVATVKGLIGGAYSTVTITGTDASPAHNAAAASVKIKYDSDKTPPVLRLLLPTKDSTSVSGNATGIQVVCTDPSGIASLTCNAGTASYTMTKSTTADSIWSGNITGLIKGQFTTLTIVSTDSSLASNKATLIVHIKYDSTMTDMTGPTITKVSGLATGARTANPNDTLIYAVSDPSGVDTVSWTLNATSSGILTAGTNGQYSIKALLTVSHTNKIILIAYDKSTNHNKSTDTTILDYNRPPVISGAHDTTIQELSTVQFTVTATDPDNDKVTLSAPTLPTGATFNATTGAFSWSPTLTQTGANTVVFKANDGLDTSTKSISIVVSNMPAPVITKNPVDTVKCLGSSAIFSVTATGTGTLSYQWKNLASNLTEGHYKGTATNTLTIDTVKATDANTYTCVVTNAGGSVATSTGAKLTVNSPSTAPTSATAQTPSICPGSFDTLTVNGGVLGTGASWTWYSGGCGSGTAIGTGSKIGVSPAATTTYYVRAEGGTCGSATSCASVSVAVNSGSTAPASATAKTPSICSGSFDTLTVTGGSLGTGGVWKWYTDTTAAALSTTGSPISVSPTATTTYWVRAEGTCGNTAFKSLTVTINTKPSTPTGTTAYSTCSGTPVTLSATAPSGTTLGWYTNSTCTTPLPSTNVSPTQTTSYYVRAERGTGKETCNVSDPLTVTVSVYSAPTFTNQPSSQNILIGKPVSFSVTPNGSSPFTYQWKFNTQNIVNATQANYNIANVAVGNGGSYTCTVTDACGQSITSNSAVLTIQCTVTYDGNGNTSGAAPNMATVNYNTSVTAPSTSLARKGFVFKGWNTKNDGSGTTYTVGQNFNVYNNVYLYAIWQVWDNDGNQYTTVTIGQQTWMVENLKTTKLNDGTALLNDVNSSGSPAYSWYNSDVNTYYIFGALYSYGAITSGKLAPAGWRLPTHDDWTQLQNALSGPLSTSGFAPTLGGIYTNSNFQDIHSTGYCWSTSQPNSNVVYIFTYSDDNNWGVDGATPVTSYCNVRCILDN